MKKFMILTVCFIVSVMVGFSANNSNCTNAFPKNTSAVVKTVPNSFIPEAFAAELDKEVIGSASTEENKTSEASAPTKTTDVAKAAEAENVQEKDTPFFTFNVVWGIIWFLFTALMLFACVRSKLDTANKLIWVMLILLTGGVGTLIYCILFLGKLPKNLFKTKEGVELGLGEGIEIKIDQKTITTLGVCKGLAEYMGWKPEYMRTLIVFLALFEWEIIAAYFIFYYVISNATKLIADVTKQES